MLDTTAMRSDLLNILVIDDSQADIQYMRRFLPNDQFKCFFAATYQSGQQIIKHGDFTVDAVILDLNLPDSSGLDTLIRFCDNDLGIPVIVVTNLSDKGLIVEAVRAGASEFVYKRDLSPVLSSLVRTAIERMQRERIVRDLSPEAIALLHKISGQALDDWVKLTNAQIGMTEMADQIASLSTDLVVRSNHLAEQISRSLAAIHKYLRPGINYETRLKEVQTLKDVANQDDD